jgi:hypothetical protein
MTTKSLPQLDANPPDEDPVDDPSIEYRSSDGEPMAESDLRYVPLTETVPTLRVRFADRPNGYAAGSGLV